MDEPPPPYASVDMSKTAGYPPKDYYPTGPPPQYQYATASYPGTTSYPAATSYPGDARSETGPANPYLPVTAEPQPQIIVAPAGVGFARFRFDGWQSIRRRYSSYSSHIMLSCFVICCCQPGMMCGCLAFCVAIAAESIAESSPQVSRQLGTASMTLSLAGIAVTLLTAVLIVSSRGFPDHPYNLTFAGNATFDDCLYPVRDRCFNSRKLVRSMRYCYDGYYLNHYCYRREHQMH